MKDLSNPPACCSTPAKWVEQSVNLKYWYCTKCKNEVADAPTISGAAYSFGYTAPVAGYYSINGAPSVYLPGLAPHPNNPTQQLRPAPWPLASDIGSFYLYVDAVSVPEKIMLINIDWIADRARVERIQVGGWFDLTASEWLQYIKLPPSTGTNQPQTQAP